MKNSRNQSCPSRTSNTASATCCMIQRNSSCLLESATIMGRTTMQLQYHALRLLTNGGARDERRRMRSTARRGTCSGGTPILQAQTAAEDSRDRRCSQRVQVGGAPVYRVALGWPTARPHARRKTRFDCSRGNWSPVVVPATYTQSMSEEQTPAEIRTMEGTHLERLVLYRLDESAQRLGQIESRLRAMELEIQTMRVKAGVWGLLAGLIPAAIIVATQVSH